MYDQSSVCVNESPVDQQYNLMSVLVAGSPAGQTSSRICHVCAGYWKSRSNQQWNLLRLCWMLEIQVKPAMESVTSVLYVENPGQTSNGICYFCTGCWKSRSNQQWNLLCLCWMLEIQVEPAMESVMSVLDVGNPGQTSNRICHVCAGCWKSRSNQQ